MDGQTQKILFIFEDPSGSSYFFFAVYDAPSSDGSFGKSSGYTQLAI
jgi:hypothetical protein